MNLHYQDNENSRPERQLGPEQQERQQEQQEQQQRRIQQQQQHIVLDDGNEVSVDDDNDHIDQHVMMAQLDLLEQCFIASCQVGSEVVMREVRIVKKKMLECLCEQQPQKNDEYNDDKCYQQVLHKKMKCDTMKHSFDDNQEEERTKLDTERKWSARFETHNDHEKTINTNDMLGQNENGNSSLDDRTSISEFTEIKSFVPRNTRSTTGSSTDANHRLLWERANRMKHLSNLFRQLVMIQGIILQEIKGLYHHDFYSDYPNQNKNR